MSGVDVFNQVFTTESNNVLFTIAQEILTVKIADCIVMCVVYLSKEKEHEAQCKGELSDWLTIDIQGKPYRFKTWNRGNSVALYVPSATLSRVAIKLGNPTVVTHTRDALIQFLKDTDYQTYSDNNTVALQLKPGLANRVVQTEQRMATLTTQLDILTRKIAELHDGAEA